MTLKLTTLALVALVGASQAHATDFMLSLTGTTSNFSENTSRSGGLEYDDFYLALDGLDSSNAITVSQGDTIESTVNLDNLYLIPASQQHTDFLQYLTSSTFPSEKTGVSGTFSLYNQGVEVASFGYGSTSSNILSSYAALFPPANGALLFNSFTNDLTIDTLATPATLDGSAFNYTLVNNAVPEPASWALMLVGFGMMGALARRRTARAAL
jgi:hypothetical protein